MTNKKPIDELTPEELMMFLEVQKAEAEKARRARAVEAAAAERKRKAEEEKAEVERIRKLQDEQLEKRDPWMWEKVQQKRKEDERAEKKRREALEQARARREKAIALVREWTESFKTETLADIADEIVAMDADGWYYAKKFGDQLVAQQSVGGDVRKLWIQRIIDARKRGRK